MKWKWKKIQKHEKQTNKPENIIFYNLLFSLWTRLFELWCGPDFSCSNDHLASWCRPLLCWRVSPDERSAALEPGECVRTVDKPAVLDTYPRECYKARDKRQSCFAGIAVPSLLSAVWRLAEHSLTFFFPLEDRLVHKLTTRISSECLPAVRCLLRWCSNMLRIFLPPSRNDAAPFSFFWSVNQ